ncbi:MBL fold metallo-hydrolase [Agromyces protaetiae]|uniref:MBL fold metallo-hydrolase n=1 Tax=Agromyces protaetiae TaxID=2509455 RepID=A0A4P6FEK0_9MICO|nr:MBL fold metallo-hydrolase [Agromyces protaetiae]QAY74345.1 MBL fold metallo-hydrolase [Agromyces protaetiae]
MQLAPGLHRIGNDLVAAFLVVTPDGLTLVDAGIPGQWRDLLAELDAIGKTPRDIRGVVLTHGDGDHLGYAERLRRDFGVPVYAHPADIARASGAEKAPSNPLGPKKLGPTLRFLSYAMTHGGFTSAHVKELLPVEDGDVLDLPGSPHIVGLPGHSPGSIAVWFPSVDAVMVGDGLTTRHVLTGAEGPAPAPFTDDPAAALASLDRLGALDATWVLPGHGPVWNGGTAELVRRVRAAAA